MHALRVAAATGDGLFVPMGFEFGARRRMDPQRGTPEDFERDRNEAPFDLGEDIAAANRLAVHVADAGCGGEMRKLTGAGEPVSMLLRADAPDVRSADRGLVVLINTGRAAEPLRRSTRSRRRRARRSAMRGRSKTANAMRCSVRAKSKFSLSPRTAPVADRARRNGRTLAEALKAPRIAIERITPSVDDGAFPIKRVVGQPITVEADIVTDGHDIVAAELLWKAADEKDWTRVPLAPLGNDRWQATFAPKRIGRHLYTIEAWRDDYASLVHEIEVKHKAGVDIALELTEARQYLEAVNAKAVPCNTTALGTGASRPCTAPTLRRACRR